MFSIRAVRDESCILEMPLTDLLLVNEWLTYRCHVSSVIPTKWFEQQSTNKTDWWWVSGIFEILKLIKADLRKQFVWDLTRVGKSEKMGDEEKEGTAWWLQGCLGLLGGEIIWNECYYFSTGKIICKHLNVNRNRSRRFTSDLADEWMNDQISEIRRN